MSLESLRFMLGGAIHRKPSQAEPIIVRHTEEVKAVSVTPKGGGAAVVVVPNPKDHLTNTALYPEASAGHPIKLINLTKGYRTQITSGKMEAYN